MALPQTIIDFNNAIESSDKWSVEQENIFIDIMAAQVKNGFKMIKTFTKGIWQTIRIEFYVKTGRKCKLKQFQNKFYNLRQRYREFTDLKKLPSGFGWDPILNTVTAPDDVWERYLKVHPEAKRFRRETCIKYNKLMIIFGNTTATGKEALASTQGVLEGGAYLMAESLLTLFKEEFKLKMPKPNFMAESLHNLSEALEEVQRKILEGDIH